MAYRLEVAEYVDKKFSKLSKKDRKQLQIINKKILKILKNPYLSKPLRGDMHGSRREHVGSFVLVFEIDEENNIIRILDYNHHDKVY